MTTIYAFQADDYKNDPIHLAQYKGQVVLIVNTASACGFTPQYEGLEKLYQKYHDSGLTILAFPCNQFKQQERKTNSEIKAFCDLNFNISFELFSKIDVNGENAHPLFVHLKEQARGILGSKSIKWNFTKFLINREGNVVKRFAPTTKPQALSQQIEELL